MIIYKKRAKLHHDQRVNPRTFLVGDLFMRGIEAMGHKTTKGKLGPKWEGPFKVERIVREGTYLLDELDGTRIENPWHANHLKRYYP